MNTAVRPAAVDWSQVTCATLRVRLMYRYAYSAPVADLRQRLIMVPPHVHGGQRLLADSLTVGGAEDTECVWQTDPFGNRVMWVTATRIAEAIEFVAEFDVERRADAPPHHLRANASPAVYLAPTALTAPNRALREAAQAIRAEVGRAAIGDADARQWELARLAQSWSARAITYRVGVTGVQTPAAMALHLGQGVCQDFAHIALTVLRLLGVPARYVSGHLLGEGVPHAWIEALLPDPAEPGRLCAVAFDPTHDRAPALNYVTVAGGRDYGDVAPTSGVYTGPNAGGQLSSEKHASVLSVSQ